MNDFQKEKLIKFINDRLMAETVKSVLRDSFLKARGSDIHVLAASKLAVDFLNEAFKEIERFKEEKEEKSSSQQVGM